METIQGRTIQGVSLEIDGKHFIDCTLINCILEYRGDPVNFERTRMRGCRHVFFGRARRTLHYSRTSASCRMTPPTGASSRKP